MNIVKMIAFVAIGLLLASFGARGIEDSSIYYIFVSFLLAIGLYSSTYGIDLVEARQHLNLIVKAVTIGVVMKAALIGCSLWLIFDDPYFLVLGVAVAQIDPLSVASLMGDGRMSKKARTILASWASFDDPISVILAIYVPIIAMWVASDSVSLGDGSSSGSLIDYGLILLLNAICIVIFYLFSRFTNKWRLSKYILVLTGIIAGAIKFLMLFVAVLGLMVRPQGISKIVDVSVVWALRIAGVMLGILLIDGVNLKYGIALGLAAYLAQVIVGMILTQRLPIKDRLHISFAQQNGITAIILALIFESTNPGTVAIVAPAIVATNSIHYIVNRFIP